MLIIGGNFLMEKIGFSILGRKQIALGGFSRGIGGLRVSRMAHCNVGVGRVNLSGLCVNQRNAVVKRRSGCVGQAMKSVEVCRSDTKRRDVLSSILLPSVAMMFQPAFAEEASSIYTDEFDLYKVAIPKGWKLEMGEASGGAPNDTRRVLVVYPEKSTPREVNLSVVVTSVAPDFTKLGSFGTPLDFGQNMVNSMDRSFLLRGAWKKPTGEVQTARLLDASDRNGKYYIQYNLRNPPEAMKYFASLIALGGNGTYNRLYTLTLQCPQEAFDTYSSDFEQVLDSFKVPARKA